MRLKSCLLWLVAWILGSAVLTLLIEQVSAMLGRHLSSPAAALLGICLALALIGLLIRPTDRAAPDS